MAILKFKEIEKMTSDEIKNKELELRQELMKLKSQVATKTAPQNPGIIRETRRTLAKIKTLKNRRLKPKR